MVLKHEVNRGKGQALRTGVAYIRDHTAFAGVITADADGQHTVHDTLLLADAMDEKKPELLLGSRDFSHKNKSIPFRSRFGNRATSTVFALLYGRWLPDTQTGLRGLPACAIPAMITIDGERYEYEMNVLLKLRDMKLGVFEVPIETIYIDDNSGSHFNPVRDAIRIYAVIFKYLFSSVTSFAVDYLLYWLCLGVFKFAPLVSYALARLVSSQVNYHLNKHTVFSGRGGRHSMVKYYALAAVQGLLGAGLVQVLPTVLPISAAVVKIPVDLLLFAVSYFIQRDFVFDK